MPAFDLAALLERHRPEGDSLFAAHINPRFRAMLRLIGFDRRWVRGEGAYLWDEAGNRVLDCLAGYAMLSLGRNHATVRDALEQCLRLAPPGFVQMDLPVLAGVLAAELKARTGFDDGIVFFTNSGTEGIEAALKFARAATGRSRFVHCASGFHGLSLGSLSINGTSSLREPFEPLLAGSHMIPFNDLDALHAALRSGDVAAFVVEPLPGKTVFTPLPGYLAEAGALCRRHGALLIADEVQTGIGRTGFFLAIDQEPDARPDIVVLSKALSGGFVPVGAVLTRAALWHRVFSSRDRAMLHSSTFQMGPLAMTAALATLHVVEQEQLVARARRHGASLLRGLQGVAGKHAVVRDVRGRGLMIGVELDVTSESKLSALGLGGLQAQLLPQLLAMRLLHDQGVLCQATSQRSAIIKLIPPLIINEADVDHIVQAFDAALTDLRRPTALMHGLARIARNAMSRR